MSQRKAVLGDGFVILLLHFILPLEEILISVIQDLPPCRIWPFNALILRAC